VTGSQAPSLPIVYAIYYVVAMASLLFIRETRDLPLEGLDKESGDRTHRPLDRETAGLNPGGIKQIMKGAKPADDQMERREFIMLVSGTAVAWPFAAQAQQSNQTRRIGAVMGSDESDAEAQSEITAFRRMLQDLGWTGGRNVRIAYRWSAGDTDRMRTFAKELMALQPDVVLATTTPVVEALLRESRAVPIVFVRVSDPVDSGFVHELARPGGNITGFVNFEPSLSTKWLGLLKEMAPRITRVTAMFNPATAPSGGSQFLRLAGAAAPSLAVELNAGPVHGLQISSVSLPPS
jgi:hypothetical protein